MSKPTEFTLLSIRQNNPITEYLLSKGHEPTKDMGDKLLYLCPVHEEKTPSFVVYLENDEKLYQEYFCFGCKSNHCIIELYSKMEDVDWRTAIARLSEGIELNDSDEIDYILKTFVKNMSKEISQSNDILGELSMKISLLGYLHLQKVDYDPEELKMLEKLYQKVDKCIRREDVASLVDIHDILVDGIIVNGERVNLFLTRYDQWEKHKNDDLKEGIIAYDSM